MTDAPMGSDARKHLYTIAANNAAAILRKDLTAEIQAEVPGFMQNAALGKAMAQIPAIAGELGKAITDAVLDYTPPKTGA